MSPKSWEAHAARIAREHLLKEAEETREFIADTGAELAAVKIHYSALEYKAYQEGLFFSLDEPDMEPEELEEILEEAVRWRPGEVCKMLFERMDAPLEGGGGKSVWSIIADEPMDDPVSGMIWEKAKGLIKDRALRGEGDRKDIEFLSFSMAAFFLNNVERRLHPLSPEEEDRRASALMNRLDDKTNISALAGEIALHARTGSALEGDAFISKTDGTVSARLIEDSMKLLEDHTGAIGAELIEDFFMELAYIREKIIEGELLEWIKELEPALRDGEADREDIENLTDLVATFWSGVKKNDEAERTEPE